MRDDTALSATAAPPPPPPPPATAPPPPAIAPMREERGDRDAEEWGEGNDDMRAKTRCTTPSAAAAQVTRLTKGACGKGGLKSRRARLAAAAAALAKKAYGVICAEIVGVFNQLVKNIFTE
jgi:hypothetical protein